MHANEVQTVENKNRQVDRRDWNGENSDNDL